MPSTKRIDFPNGQGDRLAAALHLPDRTPRAWAVFAHCFTCGKASAAATRISRTLAAGGIAVLRFDFTGLGGSEGDFGNSGFEANVDDLVAAAGFLRANHQAPQPLVGHSLGGTAVLAAAGQIDEVRAVATIGAPASPAHVLAQFGDALADIERLGSAEVTLADRPFRISRRFLEQTREADVLAGLGRLRRALLIMHAPLDDVVPIDQATEIFQAAKHPKSFLSLADADHLLSRQEEAQYVAGTTLAWAERYLDPVAAPARREVAGGQVMVTEGNRRFLRDVTTDGHRWLADEPRKAGGDDLGPDPYEHLLAALGTCTSMTIRMYANRKSWPLEDVTVRLAHRREHDRDCEACDGDEAKLDVIERWIGLVGELDQSQRERLMQIADRCPVHRTLTGKIRIRTSIEEGG
ncbi:MAG: alpha/beta fold hydrolase [bacterium]